MSLQNLFVAKLPRNLTDADLLLIFNEFKPTSAKVMLDAATGKSKGFGFVLFASEEEGKVAYKALNRKSTRACGHNFTLVIYPSNHDGKVANEPSNALYIRNIPMTVTQECVEQFLRSFGRLTYCAMREDHYGSPVWVIYAEYETVDEAKVALNKLHGNSTFFHGVAPILAKFEDSDDAKRQRRRRRETGVPAAGAESPSTLPPESTSATPTATRTASSGPQSRGGGPRAATNHPSFQVPGTQTGGAGDGGALRRGGRAGGAGGHADVVHGVAMTSPLGGYSVLQPPSRTVVTSSMGMDAMSRPFSVNYNSADSGPTVFSGSSMSSLAQHAKLHSGSPPPYGFAVGPGEMGLVASSPPPLAQAPLGAHSAQMQATAAMMGLKSFVMSAPPAPYCYPVKDKSVPVFMAGPMAGGAVLSDASLLQQTPNPTPTARAGGDVAGGFHLLNPQSQTAVVLQDGTQPFVFTKDVVNLHRQSLANVTPLSMLVSPSAAPPPSSLSPPANAVLSASSSADALSANFANAMTTVAGQEPSPQMIFLANAHGFPTLV